MKSYLTGVYDVCTTRKFVMAVLHGKQGLLCEEKCVKAAISPFPIILPSLSDIYDKCCL